MVEDNMNKIHWIIAVIVIISIIAAAILSPSYKKIEAQKTNIEGITFTKPN